MDLLGFVIRIAPVRVREQVCQGRPQSVRDWIQGLWTHLWSPHLETVVLSIQPYLWNYTTEHSFQDSLIKGSTIQPKHEDYEFVCNMQCNLNPMGKAPAFLCVPLLDPPCLSVLQGQTVLWVQERRSWELPLLDHWAWRMDEVWFSRGACDAVQWISMVTFFKIIDQVTFEEEHRWPAQNDSVPGRSLSTWGSRHRFGEVLRLGWIFLRINFTVKKLYFYCQKQKKKFSLQDSKKENAVLCFDLDSNFILFYCYFYIP